MFAFKNTNADVNIYAFGLFKKKIQNNFRLQSTS